MVVPLWAGPVWPSQLETLNPRLQDAILGSWVSVVRLPPSYLGGATCWGQDGREPPAAPSSENGVLCAGLGLPSRHWRGSAGLRVGDPRPALYRPHGGRPSPRQARSRCSWSWSTCPWAASETTCPGTASGWPSCCSSPSRSARWVGPAPASGACPFLFSLGWPQLSDAVCSHAPPLLICPGPLVLALTSELVGLLGHTPSSKRPRTAGLAPPNSPSCPALLV